MQDLVADDIFDNEVLNLQEWRCRNLLLHAPTPAAILIGWKQAN